MPDGGEGQDHEQAGERDPAGPATHVHAGLAGDEPGVEDRERVVGEDDQVEPDDGDEDLGAEHEADQRLRSAAQHRTDAEAHEGCQHDQGWGGDEDTAAAGTCRVLPEAREQE